MSKRKISDFFRPSVASSVQAEADNAEEKQQAASPLGIEPELQKKKKEHKFRESWLKTSVVV